MLEAHVVDVVEGHIRLESRWGDFECTDPDANCAQGDDVIIGIRPESFEVCTDPPSQKCSSNILRARVEVATFTGDSIEFQASADGKIIRARSNPWTNLKVGQEIVLRCPAERCVLLPNARPSWDSGDRH